MTSTMGPLLGKYAEDFNAGDKMITPSRTVTEADIAAFAGLTGDFNPLHTDEEFAKTTIFGSRIAHGMLTLSFLIGLVSRLGVLDGTVVAFMGINELRFKEPVRAGDTIHGEMTVQRTRVLGGRGAGIVAVELVAINQKVATVLTAELTLMFKSRAAVETPANPA